MSALERLGLFAAALAASLCWVAGCGEQPVQPPPEGDDAYRVSLSRSRWYPASPPVDPSGGGETLSPDSALAAIWYKIEPDERGVHRRDLNPTVEERDNTVVPSLDIELHPDTLDRAGPARWTGIMRSAINKPTASQFELDLSERRYLEVYINDFKPDPGDRGGVVYVDVGVIDEDFFEPDQDEPDFEDQEHDGWVALWDDTGLDGMFNKNDFDAPWITRFEESGITDVDSSGDDYVPSRIDGRFSKINGTERNRVEDDEDLDRSGQVDQLNAYYRYEIDLASTWPVLDIREEYPQYDGFDHLAHSNDAWRWYRVELSDGVPVSPGAPAPDLSRVRHVRIWIVDAGRVMQNEADPGRGRLQIADLKFTGRRSTE
jgi:hypothetical protein